MAQKSSSRNFWLVSFFSILVGLLYILPPIFVWNTFVQRDEPFVLAQLSTYKDELTVYLPRAREIYDGHFPPADLYFDDQKPTVMNPLPSLFFSFFIYLFDGNMNLAYLGAQFIFGSIIFALFYLVTFQLTNSQRWSFFWSFLGALTPLSFIFYRWGLDTGFVNNIVNIFTTIIKQFIPIVKTPIHKLYLARVDDQLLTYPIFLLTLLSFFKWWRNPTIFKAIMVALPSGLLFYTYFHYWVFWFTILAILFVYLLFFHKQNKFRLKSFLVLIAVAGAVALPYFINYLKIISQPDSQDYTYRFGLAVGRNWSVINQFWFHYPVYIFLAALVFWLYWHKDRQKLILFESFILVMILAGNLQLIIGFMPVPGQIAKPIALTIFIIASAVIYDALSLIKSYSMASKRFLVVTLTVLVLLKKIINIGVVAAVPPELLHDYGFPHGIVNSWSWLNKSVPPEPKIISSALVSSLYLTTYTSARPFLATGFASSMSLSTLETRYLISNKLFGVPNEILLQKLNEESNNSCLDDCYKDTFFNTAKDFRFLYVNYFISGHPVLGGQAIIPAGYWEKLLKQYDDLNPSWQKTDASYVYIGPWEKQFSRTDFDKTGELGLVYKNSEVAIYKINQ